MTWLALHLEVIAEFGALAQAARNDADNAWEEHARAAIEYQRQVDRERKHLFRLLRPLDHAEACARYAAKVKEDRLRLKKEDPIGFAVWCEERNRMARERRAMRRPQPPPPVPGRGQGWRAQWNMEQAREAIAMSAERRRR